MSVHVCSGEGVSLLLGGSERSPTGNFEILHAQRYISLVHFQDQNVFFFFLKVVVNFIITNSRSLLNSKSFLKNSFIIILLLLHAASE